MGSLEANLPVMCKRPSSGGHLLTSHNSHPGACREKQEDIGTSRGRLPAVCRHVSASVGRAWLGGYRFPFGREFQGFDLRGC